MATYFTADRWAKGLSDEADKSARKIDKKRTSIPSPLFSADFFSQPTMIHMLVSINRPNPLLVLCNINWSTIHFYYLVGLLFTAVHMYSRICNDQTLNFETRLKLISFLCKTFFTFLITFEDIFLFFVFFSFEGNWCWHLCTILLVNKKMVP